MTFWTFYVDRGDGAKLRIWVIQGDPEGDPQFLKDEFLKWKLTVGGTSCSHHARREKKIKIMISSILTLTKTFPIKLDP